MNRLVVLAIASGIFMGSLSAARSTTLTAGPVVSTVQLALTKTVVPASGHGAVAQLLITARDSSGAVIVGSGSYVGTNGKPLTISIANSSPGNTMLSAANFTGPIPSQGASNVATITYSGRSHFHFPTFTVTTPGLPYTPKAGVTLTYAPGSGDGIAPTTDDCLPQQEDLTPSVGGFFYGGPYVALGVNRQNCSLPSTADVWRMSTQPVTYNVNPQHDSIVRLGFGPDHHRVYYAFGHPGANSPTQFGELRDLTVRTSANVSSVSPLTLGNDGSLWFSGLWNGQGVIGKLPQIGTAFWRAWTVTIPHSDKIYSIEPGIGNTEVLLYHRTDGIYLGLIGTNLSGPSFKSVRISINSPNLSFGDLLASSDGNFYVSATTNGVYGSVYKITNTGQVSTYCQSVQKVYRLSDGTGVGYRDDDIANEHHAVVHVVPGGGCSAILVYPYESDGVLPFFDLLGVDSTTDDWIFYNNASGHRLGIF